MPYIFFFGTIVVGEIFVYNLFGIFGIIGLHILSLIIIFLLFKYSYIPIKEKKFPKISEFKQISE
ncbi:MAG: hypothetical protein QXR30_03705 [Candidatus Woesearchaeota archaeon]